MDEMKNDVTKHSQVSMHQQPNFVSEKSSHKDVLEKEVMRLIADREYSQKEAELMLQKEKEAKMVFEHIDNLLSSEYFSSMIRYASNPSTKTSEG